MESSKLFIIILKAPGALIRQNTIMRKRNEEREKQKREGKEENKREEWKQKT